MAKRKNRFLILTILMAFILVVEAIYAISPFVSMELYANEFFDMFSGMLFLFGIPLVVMVTLFFLYNDDLKKRR